MTVTREEILEWMSKDHTRSILSYAIAHNMEPQEVIDMMNGKGR